MVIDSGNGYHLRYHINLPNDAAAQELVRSVLRSIAARYSMLDVTNHNAARVANFRARGRGKVKTRMNVRTGLVLCCQKAQESSQRHSSKQLPER